MPNRQTWITHRFGGGWATDLGLSFNGAPTNGVLVVPWLADALNVVYELNGGIHKMPGTTKFNATVISGATTVKGLYDYWRQGTGILATQRVVVHADTRVLAAQVSDGVFSVVGTGLSSGAVPHYSTFDDFLIIGSSASADVPRSWDQTTFQNLAGSPPRFSFSVSHKNRQWAAGVYTTPSRLYYSASLDPEDWTGAGSGSIDIDPNDGDSITGLASFRNELIVFKGPYKGSIHRITGSAPTGSDSFARTTVMEGITAAYQNCVFNLPNDLGFVSPRGTVHSLVAVNQYGDYQRSALSFPINRTLRADLDNSSYKNWWAVDDYSNGYVLIAITPSGQTRNTRLLLMDYRFVTLGEPYPRWAQWTTFGADALGLVVDTNNRPRHYVGLNAGFVWKLNTEERLHDGGAIAYTATLPFLTYGADHVMKTLYTVGVELNPKSGQNLTFNWLRDGQTEQSETIGQGGSDVLGPWTSNQFTLGTSALGGTRFLTRYRELETGGEFRAVRYKITENNASSDLEVHGIVAAVEGGSVATEN